MRNMRTPLMGWLLLIGLLWLQQAIAGVEFVPLRHTTPQQMLPLVQPFLEPGETVIPGRNELIVNASEASLQSIRQVVARYDRRADRLMVSVRLADDASNQAQQIKGQVRGTIDPSHSSQVSGQVRIYDNQANRNRQQEQMVQVLDGHPAYIHYGQSEPTQQLTIRSTPFSFHVSEQTVYQDVTSGFVVTPRLIGDNVQLEVDQWSDEAKGRHDGGYATQQTITTIQAPLDQWVTLSGIQESDRNQDRGLLSRSVHSRSQDLRLQIKVRRLDPAP